MQAKLLAVGPRRGEDRLLFLQLVDLPSQAEPLELTQDRVRPLRKSRYRCSERAKRAKRLTARAHQDAPVIAPSPADHRTRLTTRTSCRHPGRATHDAARAFDGEIVQWLHHGTSDYSC